VSAVHFARVPATGSVVVNVSGMVFPVVFPSATQSERDAHEITGWASGTG
jgi:hypothetical protein